MASYAPLPPVREFADGRTHAATLKPSSASTTSMGENPFGAFNLEVIARDTTELLDVCAQSKRYNLADLTQSTQLATCGVSDQVCLTYLRSVFRDTNKYECVKEQVDMFKVLPPLYCTDRQTPDVCVYLKENGKKMIVLLVEVHSSPYANSINKVVIGVIEQLRLYRMTNPNMISCIGFAFPKLPSPSSGDCCASENKRSVVQVTVTWENFSFVYDLKSLPLADVARKLTDAVVKVNGVLFLEHPETRTKRFVVQLSLSDLNEFGANANAIQVASRSSILVQANEKYYKLPTTKDAAHTLSMLVSFRPSQLTLQVEQVQGVIFVTYPKQPYDPMDRSEANACLRDLVKEVAGAIKDLHRNGWAHQDIRLDNICFTREHKPILIDLDRLRLKKAQPLRFQESCMYQEGFDPFHTDWLQLGWLAAWVHCTYLRDYHSMKVDDLPSECTNDTFLMGLIKHGEYCGEELQGSIISTPSHLSPISVVLDPHTPQNS